MNYLTELSMLGVRMSFSRNCHSGIQSLLGTDHKCGCWRCRRDRGEEWTEETEKQAEIDSNNARKAMKERVNYALRGEVKP